MSTKVVIKHPRLGIGEITEISFDTDDPLVSVQFNSGKRNCYWVEEIEFLVVNQK